MTVGRDLLLDQLDWHWKAALRPRLDGLTDEEYLWEPAPGCWTVRPTADGRFVVDFERPEPSPPPFTTIAWRMCHIAVSVLAMRANYHFGDRSLTFDEIDWPGSAAEGIALLERSYAAWRDGIASRPEEFLDRRSEGPPGTLDAQFPFAQVILHINRETIHHGAEIALLRDLYRARGGRA